MSETNLERWRKQRGFSCQQAADKFGCSGEHVRLMCNGERYPSRKLARKIVAETDGDLSMADLIPIDHIDAAAE